MSGKTCRMRADINNTNSPVNADQSPFWKLFTLTGAASFSFLGIPPNVLSIVLILRAQRPKSITTYFLLNLAIADIVNLLSVLLVAILIFAVQRLSNEGLRNTILTISVPPKAIVNLTLALIALERYNGLIKTMKPFVNLSTKKIKVILIVIWSICFTAQTPVFVYRLVHGGGSKELIRVYYSVCIATTYFFTILVVVFCYGSILKGIYYDGSILGQNATDETALAQKKRCICTMILVTVIFVLFNLPSATIKILTVVGVKVSGNDLFIIVLPLGCISSTVNPYLYILRSENYRQQIVQLFCRRHTTTTIVKNKNRVEV